MYLRGTPWVLVVILAARFQCATTHVLERRMEGFLPFVAKSGKRIFKGFGSSSDNARQLAGTLGSSSDNARQLAGTPGTRLDPEIPHGSSSDNARQLGPTPGRRFDPKEIPELPEIPEIPAFSGGGRRLERFGGKKIDLKLADNAVANVEARELTQEIDALLARSHYAHPADPVPESLERYVLNRRSDDFDDERFSFDESDAETVRLDPIYLDVLHADPKKVPPQTEVANSYKQLQEAGRLLTKLTPEQRIQQPVDVNFMVKEFENTWLKHIPPDKAKNPEVSAKVKDVSGRIKPLVLASKKHAQLEADLAEPLANWKKFDKKLGQGLQDALTVYAKDQTGKAVASQLANHFKTWDSSEMQQVAASSAERFLKDFHSEDITRLHDMAFPSRQNIPITEAFQRSELQQFLVEKLRQVPHERDEEYRFISERLSTKYYAKLMRKSNKEIATSTPEQIAADIQVGTDDLMHLKFHFAIVNPSEKAAQSILKTKLDSLVQAVAGDPKLMKAAYQSKVKDIVVNTNFKVETQLFKENFGIALSSDQLVEKMIDLGKAWNPDLKAFETQFKNKLPKEEYAQLSQAAAVSKELYAATLESIKETRKIDHFQFLESRAFVKGHQYSSDTVLDFVYDLEEQGIIDSKLAESLFKSGESSGEITSRLSAEAAATALKKLHEELQIDLFQKLEIRSIPQLDLSPATSDITKFLDELTTAKLITPEERHYFYPLHPGSTPISSVEDFAAKIGRMVDFAQVFQNRLIERLNANFDQITRDAPSFRSGFLTKEAENEIKRQKEEINELLDKNEYTQVFQRLRPQSIEENLHQYWSDEFVGQELWDDYFSKKYTTYKLYPIDKQRAHGAQNVEQKNTSPPNAQELKNLALSKLSPPDRASSSDESVAAPSPAGSSDESVAAPSPAGSSDKKVAAPSSATLTFKNKKTEFPDDRHFVLLHDPLKPMKGNDATQTPPLADARFQNTAFRYLDKKIMDEWNASVKMIPGNKARYQEDLILRDAYVTQIQKAMQSEALRPYSGIIGKIFADINSRFSFGFNSQGKVLYKLTPSADDPRVQEAFRGIDIGTEEKNPELDWIS